MSTTNPTSQIPVWTLTDRLVKARHIGGFTQDELGRLMGHESVSTTMGYVGFAAPAYEDVARMYPVAA